MLVTPSFLNQIRPVKSASVNSERPEVTSFPKKSSSDFILLDASPSPLLSTAM